MESSWIVALASVLIVSCEGIASWTEKTFWPGQQGGKPIKLPFVLHGGVVIGDLILLSYAYGIWVPHLEISARLWVILFPIALWITWKCHRAWWFMCEKQPGFMYPDRSMSGGDQRYWYDDLPCSAWIHFVYMTGSLMFIGAYIWSPMSPEVVWRTFWIFVAFVPTAIIEPGIVQGWPLTKKDIMVSVGVALVLWTIVGLVTWLKIIHWLGI